MSGITFFYGSPDPFVCPPGPSSPEPSRRHQRAAINTEAWLPVLPQSKLLKTRLSGHMVRDRKEPKGICVEHNARVLRSWRLLRSLRTSKFHSQNLHHIRSFSSPQQQFHHELHRAINMRKEGFVTGAKIVQTWFSIRSLNKSIARTFAIASELYFTVPAIARQGVLLGILQIAAAFPTRPVLPGAAP